MKKNPEGNKKKETRHLFQTNDLFSLKSVAQARLSPDGRSLVYCVSQVDAERLEETSALWLLDLSTREKTRLTFGNRNDVSPVWSPDGQSIAFLSTRSGSMQIHILPLRGGEAFQLTTLEQGVGCAPVWSPDGKQIAFTAGPEGKTPEEGKPYHITRSIWHADGIGLLKPALQNIHLVCVDTKEERTLAELDCFNNVLSWSVDGEKILFSSTFFADTLDFSARLRSVSMDSEVIEWTGEWGSVFQALWHPSGEGVLFAGVKAGQKMGTKTDLWYLARPGDTPLCLGQDLKTGILGDLQGDFPAVSDMGQMIVSPDGKQLFVPVQVGGEMQVYCFPLDDTKKPYPVLDGDRLCALQDVGDNHLVYLVSSHNEPGDLYQSDPAGGQETRLTEINAEFLSDKQLPEVEQFTFQSCGDSVEGWLMKPVEGEAPWPTILYIHGGPVGAFGSTFFWDFQMLSANGFAVLFINPHGSSGYGSDFATSIHADWGNLDYQDMMTALDFVIDKGWSDPNRLGVAGLSYGGYMSCWMVGQTDRFKAAVPENPLVRLDSAYGTSDISPFVLEKAMGGKPHEVPEVYRKCSPLTRAHMCKTPTLLIQGEGDLRCPAEQSEQFYRILKQEGCIVEMLRLPGGSHMGSISGAPVLRKAQNEALLEWMQRYILAKTKRE